MISQIFDSSIFKVIALFALSPGSRFKRKEIKGKTKLNNVPLDRALERLLHSGIIKQEKGLYSVNHESKDAMQIISMAEAQYKYFKNLPFDIYVILIDMAEEFSSTKNIEIWLFGSYAKLVYSDKSDIDIAFLAGDKKINKEKIKGKLKKISEKYNKQIEEHIFPKKDFYRNKKDPLVKEILQHGIRLV